MKSDQDPSQEEKIPVSAINQLFVYLEDYNRKFNIWVSAAKMLSQTPDNDGSSVDDIDAHRAQGLLSHEELKDMLAPVLNATGLEIESVENGQSLSSSKGSEKGTELRINIKDGKRFVTFLKSTDATSMTEEDKDGLVQVAEVLLTQFVSQYDITDPNDERFLELMGSLSNIIAEYKRLDGGSENLSFAIAPLENYLMMARKGCLVEYRLAEELKLHKPFSDKGFTLRWHTDCNPDLLEKNWNSVITTLQTISQNENARKDLYDQAASTAKRAIEAALKDVGDWEDTDAGYETRKKDFLAILQKVKARLEEF